jgi:hypothetical protein
MSEFERAASGAAERPLWSRMNGQQRRAAQQLSSRDIPAGPGVYAWYRDGEPVYSGRATGRKGLRERIWRKHLEQGNDLSRSSFRRNVCAYLGIAPTNKTATRPTQMTASDVEPVNTWIRDCEVAWIECGSPADAKELEEALHREWLPPLGRR